MIQAIIDSDTKFPTLRKNWNSECERARSGARIEHDEYQA